MGLSVFGMAKLKAASTVCDNGALVSLYKTWAWLLL
jgi:hypothetical protein